MPPKVKITKENIVNTALEIVKNSGVEALNARNIAIALNCSTQPIFSNFESMEDLKFAVAENANELYKKYIKNEVSKGEYPEYKASGMAYIRFAKEEKELFKLLFMCDRQDRTIPKDTESFSDMARILQNSVGLHRDSATLFHLEMWVYVHGIATMFATDFLDLEWELISKMMSDCYQGLKKQYGLEE